MVTKLLQVIILFLTLFVSTFADSVDPIGSEVSFTDAINKIIDKDEQIELFEILSRYLFKFRSQTRSDNVLVYIKTKNDHETYSYIAILEKRYLPRSNDWSVKIVHHSPLYFQVFKVKEDLTNDIIYRFTREAKWIWKTDRCDTEVEGYINRWIWKDIIGDDPIVKFTGDIVDCK